MNVCQLQHVTCQSMWSELGPVLLCSIKLSMLHMCSSMLYVAACNTVLCIAIELASYWNEPLLHMQNGTCTRYPCGFHRGLGFSGFKMTWGLARPISNCFISLDSKDCDNVVMLTTAGAGADRGRHLIALLRVHSTSSLLLCMEASFPFPCVVWWCIGPLDKADMVGEACQDFDSCLLAGSYTHINFYYVHLLAQSFSQVRMSPQGVH